MDNATHNSTGSGVLGALANVNGEVAIVLQAGAVVLPLIKGIVREIKAGVGGGTVTIEYTDAVAGGEANLDHTMQVDGAIIDDINAELVRQGVAPLATPDDAAKPPVAP